MTKTRCTIGFRKCIKNLLDCSLSRNMFMNLFLANNFMYYFWIDVPFMYSTDYAVSVGVGRSEAVRIVSLMGVAITLGQIAFGIVGDMRVDVLLIFATVTVLGGLLVACVPIMQGVVAMSLCFIFLGFCLSMNSALSCPLLVRYIGLKHLANGYGLLMMVQGMGNFIGPIVAGWISDVTGSYEYIFYICGALFCLSGLVLYLFYLPKCCAIR